MDPRELRFRMTELDTLVCEEGYRSLFGRFYQTFAVSRRLSSVRKNRIDQSTFTVLCCPGP
jgi:hypothetical protein